MASENLGELGQELFGARLSASFDPASRTRVRLKPKDHVMTVFQRVLVAVDGSPASLHALQAAFQVKSQDLAIIAVAPGSASGPRSEADHDLDAYWQEAQTKALAAAAELAGAAGVSLTTLSDRGEPHERIVAAAESAGHDLIVVGLKGRDLPAGALMGSTTARVIGYSPKDVLVVPEHANLGFERLILPTDGSRFSRRAATRALEICRAYGGELMALAVLDAPPRFLAEAPEVARDLLAKLEALTAEVQQRAAAQGIPCHTVVQHGPAYRVITDQAGNAGARLIVMGAHGRTGLKRLLMGSVTERVLGYAPCPVLVVKGKE
jgi:nucleotide-binding universal stress UspA family protein